MTKYYLGIDVGGSKSHALIATEQGEAVGFGAGGAGNWEVVGHEGLRRILLDITTQATSMAQIEIGQIAGAGMGLGGYDWPDQRQPHLETIASLGLQCPLEIANDATLGILAGAEGGWGISIVAGSGSNCRGRSKDRKREGRAVGGAGEWSGEPQGGFGLIARAMQAVSFEWTRRGPSTALTAAFIQRFGAKDLDDLIEGFYLGKYQPQSRDVMMVFEIAEKGDPEALEAIRWHGNLLGDMACGAIRQCNLEAEIFDVVLIGSLWDGHPLLADSLGERVHSLAPAARLVRLTVPPVVGGVLLGMEVAGVEYGTVRKKLIDSFDKLRSDSRK